METCQTRGFTANAVAALTRRNPNEAKVASLFMVTDRLLSIPRQL